MKILKLKELIEDNIINCVSDVKINDAGDKVEYTIFERFTFNVVAEILPNGNIRDSEDSGFVNEFESAEDYAEFLRCED